MRFLLGILELNTLVGFPQKNGERALIEITLLSSSSVNWQLEHAGRYPARNVPSTIQALHRGSHHGNTCPKRNIDPGVACTRPKGLTSPTSGGLRGRDGAGVALGARATCSKVRHQSMWRQNGSGSGHSARAPTGSPPRLPGAFAVATAPASLSGSGPPAARPDISRCGDKTAAAAANRRVRQRAHLPDFRGPPRARRR